MIRFFYILFFSMFFVTVKAQKTAVLLREANFYFSQEDYYAAAHFYEEVFQKDSSNVQLWWQMAQTYRFTYQYNLAAQFYAKVLQADHSNSYPEVQLWQGMMLKQTEAYEEAIIVLGAYLDAQLNPSDYYYRKALMELKGAYLALEMPNTETTVRHLNQKINSKVSDFAPFALGDTLLYFASLEKGDGTETEQLLGHHAKIFQSKNEKMAKVLRIFNATDFHVGNISFNPTADAVFFTKCKQEKEGMRCRIFTAQKKNNLWQDAVLMSDEINFPNSNNTHPQWAFWQGLEGLFFSSDRAGGYGGMDLWFAPLKGPAVNLGSTLNTDGNEITPFYHSVEKKLYFSSDFHPGIGGFDIFQTSWDSLWGIVENTGYPLNSPHNDLYYNSRIDDPLKGYISSNRKGSLFVTKESCCNDLYAFEKSQECACERIDSLKRQIQLNLPISLYFHNDQPNPNSRDTTSGVNYADAYKEYYQMKATYQQRFSQVLTGNLKSQAEKEMQDFFELTIQQGFTQLELFASQLKMAIQLEAKLEIRLKGYTSPLTDTAYNMALAKRRISSVQNYLSNYQNGILAPYLKSGQLTIKELPFGETQVQKGVSDNPNDRRQSVYSIAAARERRIEIQSISVEL